DMVIALSYQIDTGHSATFRKWLINKVVRNQAYNLLLYLNKDTNHTLYC
ncbi:lipofamily protein, partial [Bifidobacterium longum]